MLVACMARDRGRVLPGRHLDGCPEPDTCPGCLPCPDHHCLTCRRNHADVTCPVCLATTRDDLREVETLTSHLHDEAVHGRRSLSSQIPGGDALVLLGPGNYYADHLAHSEERPSDPRPPYVVVQHWAAWWADESGSRYPYPDALADLTDYLDGQLHQIAGDPVFTHLARDLSRLRRRIEDVLYDGERPEVSRVPCLACGTRLHKVWETKVEDDHWRCPRCGETYNQGRFERAKHDHLASRGAERYVPIPMAIAAIGRPEQTVRAWIRRGLVDTRRDEATGRLFAWWPDVRAAHLAARTSTRRPHTRNQDRVLT